MKTFVQAAALGAALVGLAGVANASTDIIDVTTHYQFGAPADNNGLYVGGPDTGFVTFTNNGTASFTGTLSDLAVTSGATNYSQSFSVTLAPGAHFTFGTSPESSNVGGFNGPAGSAQPGIQLLVNGAFSDGYAVSPWSVFDRDIHSGTINGGGLTDAYVLQGGSPTGGDNGDGIEVAQADGQFVFSHTSGGVPEPATWAMMLVGFGGLGAAIRARRKQDAALFTA